ncbi:MAG TPA: hypothetical protein VMT58_01845 [Candidatus Binataceae bacterium]|nr:hypothetical protein [Candidatus Binataceae bacterium]
MKRLIGLALATGLALVIAGCAAQEEGGGGGGGAAAAGGGEASRNFNLAVKCPGVHWEKSHGWSDDKIMEHESIDQSDIAACEDWAKQQPKGYVPPPAPGTTPPPVKPAAK